jgi:hypothetical protein
MTSKQKALGCGGYAVAGFLLMLPLGMVFDDMKWPLFHGWGLAHGSFILAWLLLTLMCFLVHRMIEKHSA